MKADHRITSRLLVFAALVAPTLGQAVQRVSVGTGNKQAFAQSGDPSISWEGRFIAFASEAPNLVPGDTNDVSDVFVHDRQTGVTERVSVGSQGQEGDAESYQPNISARGRFVVFTSHASNFVPGDTPGTVDVFLHDRRSGLIQCVSVNAVGVPGTGGSWPYGNAVVSPNGRFVAFESGATDLVDGQTTAGSQVYLRDIWAGTTECVSVDNAGVHGWVPSSGPSMTADGRYVAFTSYDSFFSTGPPTVHAVLVRDRQVATTTMIVMYMTETEHPSFSFDGRYLAFKRFDIQSPYFNIVRRDMLLGTTTLVSHGPSGELPNHDCNHPSLSPNGRYLSFDTSASNILPNPAGPLDTPLTGSAPAFRWDSFNDETRVVGADASGTWENRYSARPSVSMFGQVAFESTSSNLVPLDTNGVRDVFVKAP